MVTNLEMLKDSEEDLEWFNNNFEEIQKRFPNQFVAIKDKKIVGFARKIELLFEELRKKNIDEAEVLIEIVYPKGEITIL